MFWKRYSSIIVVLFLINVVTSDTDISPLKSRNIQPPGMSPQASMPTNNQVPEVQEPLPPSRPRIAPPGRNPQSTVQQNPQNFNQPIASGPIRNHVGSQRKPSRNANVNQPRIPTPVNNNDAVPEEQPQNMNSNQPIVDEPIDNNVGVVQEEPTQNLTPNQVDEPMNSNGEVPIENDPPIVQEEPSQNPNPPFNSNPNPNPNPNPNFNSNPNPPNRNVPMRNNGVVQPVGPSPNRNSIPRTSNRIPVNNVAPQFPASNTPVGTTSSPQGSTGFGGPLWPSFFRQPHGATNNAAPTNMPMQNPPPNGGQMTPNQNSQVPMDQNSQSTPSVDQLLSKLNTLFGNNNVGNGGLGR